MFESAQQSRFCNNARSNLSYVVFSFGALWRNRAGRGEGEGEVSAGWELLCDSFIAKHSTVSMNLAFSW